MVARARVGEEQVPLGVDDDDAVGGALEEVGVALQGAQAPLGLEARDGDLLRLVAQRLHDARVAQRDGHRVRHGPAEGELALAEGEGVPGAQEEDAHRAPLVEDGQDRERAERALVALVAHDLEQRVRRDVGDDERLAAREHLLDLGVLREVDGQIAQLLVVARGDDVADVARLAHEDDAHAVDPRDLGDALDDGEEDAAEVEVRRERLRELEDERARPAPSCASASTQPRRRSCPRMRATSSTGLKGLRTKSSAPASNALAISSSASSAVSTTTGRSRVSGRARRMRRIW